MSKQRFVFVLRLWNEAATHKLNDRLELRGSLHLVNSEQVTYFHSLDDIPQFLREMTGWSTMLNEVKPTSPQKEDDEPNLSY